MSNYPGYGDTSKERHHRNAFRLAYRRWAKAEDACDWDEVALQTETADRAFDEAYHLHCQNEDNPLTFGEYLDLITPQVTHTPLPVPAMSAEWTSRR